MGSTVIAIPDGERMIKSSEEKRNFALPFVAHMVSFVEDKNNKDVIRKVIHSVKVGVALVLVSLLYLLDPLYKQVGDNAMWAIMTVVVIFELFAGAMLSKGLNRGLGTVLGGGLGCLAAAIAQQAGTRDVGNAIIVGSFVFIFGAAATYTRLIPIIKQRYDYGVMIFILTFNLVVVSGLRADKILKVARERLLTIFIGFMVCIFTSLLVFPIWAGDDLHNSLASRFSRLADSIEGCLVEYFRVNNEKEDKPGFSFTYCKSLLHSKPKDESLANFARWEPWHGRFGFSHPWTKYLDTAELLTDLATAILSLKPCLHSPKESSQSLKEPCESVGSSLCSILRELGDSITEMRQCESRDMIVQKLKTVRQELSQIKSPSRLGQLEINRDELATASFLFSLTNMVDKVEQLAKDVEELGKLANFKTK